MSYCVNCGVELEASLKECPLCNTPVINPKELEKKHRKTAFSQGKGAGGKGKKKRFCHIAYYGFGSYRTDLRAAESVCVSLLCLVAFDYRRLSDFVGAFCAGHHIYKDVSLYIFVFGRVSHRDISVSDYLCDQK